ncbi:helix-turn-helix domain-containing protein [Endozoicomonas atrinae]|uniref:helix-turn-helix domain-containing protein n=1 Tax=Endozoicomonas atrinae TaxID=1333660 RepID=UPI000826034C|nr:helix-turn-helix domain-containing protein [Endozoicomonas atrinae]
MIDKSIAQLQLPIGQPVQIVRVDEVNRKDYQRVPHRHDYFEVIWTEEGRGAHCIDFTEYPLRPKTLYLIAPGQVHQIISPPDLMYVMSFQMDFIGAGYRNQLLLQEAFATFSIERACISLDTDGYRHLDYLGEMMEYELKRSTTDWDLLEALLTAFLHYLTRYFPDNNPESVYFDPRVMKLFELIEKHYREYRHNNFYGDEIGLTPKRLNELTRQYVGKTVTQLIHERVMVAACRELAFTTKTVQEIAFGLGYEDTSYFCRFFRREIGVSPRKFRSQVFA